MIPGMELAGSVLRPPVVIIHGRQKAPRMRSSPFPIQLRIRHPRQRRSRGYRTSRSVARKSSYYPDPPGDPPRWEAVLCGIIPGSVCSGKVQSSLNILIVSWYCLYIKIESPRPSQSPKIARANRRTADSLRSLVFQIHERPRTPPIRAAALTVQLRVRHTPERPRHHRSAGSVGKENHRPSMRR